MARNLPLVFVLFLVVLAGCGGTPGGTAVDSDNDGLTDSKENELGTDPTVADTDEDGLNDSVEINEYETDPTVADTDEDGLNDSVEINEYETDPTVADTDEDGLNDSVEINEYETDPTVADTDEDGLNDGAEINEYETDPTVADTDEDGLNDGAEINEYETDPTVADTDEDGLNDGAEINEYETDPTVADTDEDGLNDGEEINVHETSPLTANSDTDDLNDGEEVNNYGTDPNDADTDNDGIRDENDENPLHEDMYVGIRNKPGCSISDSDFDGVIDAFNTAPISNPNGENGINLHILDEDDPNFLGDRTSYHIATFQTGITDPDGMDRTGYASGKDFYVDCTYDDSRVSSAFMHELGHVSGIGGSVRGVDSTKIPFADYRSIMNYNAPSDYIGYAERDWEIIANQHNLTYN